MTTGNVKMVDVSGAAASAMFQEIVQRTSQTLLANDLSGAVIGEEFSVTQFESTEPLCLFRGRSPWWIFLESNPWSTLNHPELKRGGSHWKESSDWKRYPGQRNHWTWLGENWGKDQWSEGLDAHWLWFHPWLYIFGFCTEEQFGNWIPRWIRRCVTCKWKEQSLPFSSNGCEGCRGQFQRAPNLYGNSTG